MQPTFQSRFQPRPTPGRRSILRACVAACTLLGLPALTPAEAAEEKQPANGSVSYLEPIPGQMGDLAVELLDHIEARPGQVLALIEVAPTTECLLLEAADTPSAWKRAGQSSEAKQFVGDVNDLLVVPLLRRGAVVPSGLPDLEAAGDDAVLSVTHVDVMPQHVDDAKDPIQALLEAYRSADQAAVATHAWTEAATPNHTTLLVVWSSLEAAQQADANTGVRKARRSLSPMLGSPFNRRIFRTLAAD